MNDPDLPVWLQDAVGSFGRRLGLSSLTLNERGVAAVRFENGAALRLERAPGSLCVSVAFPCASDPATLARLLALAHPDNRTAFPIRAARLPRTGEGILVARLAERAVTPTALDTVFSGLWTLANGFLST